MEGRARMALGCCVSLLAAGLTTEFQVLGVSLRLGAVDALDVADGVVLAAAAAADSAGAFGVELATGREVSIDSVSDFGFVIDINGTPATGFDATTTGADTTTAGATGGAAGGAAAGVTTAVQAGVIGTDDGVFHTTFDVPNLDLPVFVILDGLPGPFPTSANSSGLFFLVGLLGLLLKVASSFLQASEDRVTCGPVLFQLGDVFLDFLQAIINGLDDSGHGRFDVLEGRSATGASEQTNDTNQQQLNFVQFFHRFSLL